MQAQAAPDAQTTHNRGCLPAPTPSCMPAGADFPNPLFDESDGAAEAVRLLLAGKQPLLRNIVTALVDELCPRTLHKLQVGQGATCRHPGGATQRSACRHLQAYPLLQVAPHICAWHSVSAGQRQRRERRPQLVHPNLPPQQIGCPHNSSAAGQ